MADDAGCIGVNTTLTSNIASSPCPSSAGSCVVGSVRSLRNFLRAGAGPNTKTISTFSSAASTAASSSGSLSPQPHRSATSIRDGINAGDLSEDGSIHVEPSPLFLAALKRVAQARAGSPKPAPEDTASAPVPPPKGGPSRVRPRTEAVARAMATAALQARGSYGDMTHNTSAPSAAHGAGTTCGSFTDPRVERAHFLQAVQIVREKMMGLPPRPQSAAPRLSEDWSKVPSPIPAKRRPASAMLPLHTDEEVDVLEEGEHDEVHSEPGEKGCLASISLMTGPHTT